MSAAASMAAHGKATRRHKHVEHEEHENHERWLITYADMITLLMVLFIVLFAIGQTDLAKFEKLKEGLENSFGARGDSVLDSSGGGLLTGATDTGIQQLRTAEAAEALAARDAARQAIAVDQAALQETASTLDEQLTAAGIRGEVDLRVERRGLIVTIVTDQVLFRPGSDLILPAGHELLAQIATSLAVLPNPITVEGHTDDTPINDGRFASNWELSTARATSVLRQLMAAAAITPDRVSASGYADQRPIADNHTAEGRTANRRVEIVVHSLVEEEDIVDEVAGTDTPPTTVTAVGDPIPEVDHVQEEGH